MDFTVEHRCGHSHCHSILATFASEGRRYAERLAQGKCPACAADARKVKRAAAADRHASTLAHLQLPALTGSPKQVAWAETIRSERLAMIFRQDPAGVEPHLLQTEAKWWIDRRSLDLG